MFSRQVAGLNWEGGAIGTAVWSGARLVDVLQSAGVKIDDPRVKHVHFEGADLGPDGLPYGKGYFLPQNSLDRCRYLI